MTSSTLPPELDLLKFPCDFSVKVMGKKDEAFETAVFAIVKQHFPDIKENAIKQRDSKKGNYLALTITVHAEDKASLDKLYQALTDAPEVLMAL